MLSDAVRADVPMTTQQQELQLDQQPDPPPPPPPQQEPDHGREPPPLPGTGGRPVRASYELQLKVRGMLMAMTDEEKIALGHSVTDLIVDCEFAGTTCSPSYVNYRLLFCTQNYRTRRVYWTAR